MIGNQDYGGICKLNIGKPNRWMFLISEPLHNENEKKGQLFYNLLLFDDLEI